MKKASSINHWGREQKIIHPTGTLTCTIKHELDELPQVYPQQPVNQKEPDKATTPNSQEKQLRSQVWFYDIFDPWLTRRRQLIEKTESENRVLRFMISLYRNKNFFAKLFIKNPNRMLQSSTMSKPTRPVNPTSPTATSNYE